MQGRYGPQFSAAGAGREARLTATDFPAVVKRLTGRGGWTRKLAALPRYAAAAPTKGEWFESNILFFVGREVAYQSKVRSVQSVLRP